MRRRAVIVGANLAGASAALTLRQHGYRGEVVLVGEEPHPPYERPPLSKEYLRGEVPLSRLTQAVEIRAEHEIECHLGRRVVEVDPYRGRVKLDDGRTLAYDQLLLATGARNRRLGVPGHDLDGVLSLRTVEDADRIRSEAVPGRRAVLVGMGFIGCELAASLTQMGVRVTAVEPLPAPLSRVVGVEIGRVVEAVHREHGVELVLGEGVAAFEGVGRVRQVLTDRGARLGCDFVVVGVGVEPVAELAAAAGVKVDDGIVVDERCRTTVEAIFAAGDVANHLHPLYGRHLRVEHWQNAIHQGRAAALSMLGRGEPYAEVHWFWSDQYQHNIQCAGHSVGLEPAVVRGSLEARNFVAFYLERGRLVGAVAMDRGRDLRRAMALIKAAVAPDPAQLGDESVDLRQLLPTAQAEVPSRPRPVARPFGRE